MRFVQRGFYTQPPHIVLTAQQRKWMSKRPTTSVCMRWREPKRFCLTVFVFFCFCFGACVIVVVFVIWWCCYCFFVFFLTCMHSESLCDVQQFAYRRTERIKTTYIYIFDINKCGTTLERNERENEIVCRFLFHCSLLLLDPLRQLNRQRIQCNAPQIVCTLCVHYWHIRHSFSASTIFITIQKNTVCEVATVR